MSRQAAPPSPGGNKTVGAESAPVITAVLIVSALQDTYGLLVQHEGWWELTPNIFTLAGFALFFGLRRLNTAAGRPLDVEAAENARGIFPIPPAGAEATPRAAPPGWPLVPGAVLLVAIAAGCTYAAMQAAGWIRP